MSAPSTSKKGTPAKTDDTDVPGRARPGGKAPPPRITKFAMSDVALSRISLFRPSGNGPSNGRAPLADAYAAGLTTAVTDALEIKDPEHGEIVISFLAGHQCSAREEDLLLVLMAFACLAGTKRAPKGVIGGPVRRGSELHGLSVQVMQGKGTGIEGDVYVVQVPRRTLVKEWRGRAVGGDDYAELADALKRLGSIRYDVSAVAGNSREDVGGCGLLTFRMQEGGTSTTDVRVTFSPRMARVLLGLDMPSKAALSKSRRRREDAEPLPRARFFSRINLDERFALQGQISRLVHRYLSSVVNEARGRKPIVSKPILLETVIRSVWGPASPEPKLDSALNRRDPERAAKNLHDELAAWRDRPRFQRRDVTEACEAISATLKAWSIEKLGEGSGRAAIVVTRYPQRTDTLQPDRHATRQKSGKAKASTVEGTPDAPQAIGQLGLI